MMDLGAWEYTLRFSEVYPALAVQILDATGVFTGRCLDVGAGAGHQGLALARASDLFVTLLDKSPEGLALAAHTIAEESLGTRVECVEGTAERLPFADGSFDLVVSRGSIDFWVDPAAGLREAYRVLRAGGWAWIGGGFASVQQRIRVNLAGGDEHGSSLDTLRNPMWQASVRHCLDAAEASGVRPYRFLDDAAGIWIIFNKEEEYDEVE